MVGGISLLVVMGFELAMLTVLTSATDTEAAVSLVVALSTGPAFMIPILVGLVGFFLTLPLLALALWRSRVVPIVVPLLFALPRTDRLRAPSLRRDRGFGRASACAVRLDDRAADPRGSRRTDHITDVRAVIRNRA